MSSNHIHSVNESKSEKPLWIALVLTTAFLIAEVTGGILTNSLALISDAAHMFTDAAALAVSLVAIRIGRRAADNLRTFGYYRFEILAAAFNAVLLFLVAMYILYEAYQRINNPPQIQSGAMLVVATLGLVINLISMRLLADDKDKSLNVKGAYLEVWSDMLGSIGVIAGAIIIRFTAWTWVDSAIAVLIGLWVLPRTWTLLKESLNVLLEGVPEGLNILEVEATIKEIACVVSVHDLHVWAISSGKASLTAHVVTELALPGQQVLLKKIRETIAEKFDIHHCTMQLEIEPCEDAGVHGYGARSPTLGGAK
ncbi:MULTISPECIES: cation diffusion facilitator family transporter [Oxalobacteraceae]|uniref:cation diffusion facilitator family transporter n=1 Tax=Oxalobacteraceae TaxID=75682 RepID=UPI0002AE7F46|nr:MULTISPECIES: cation diffusion facilitator family transporter [Oxalobacteraceae]ELX08359.1 cobalt-zinc-cadmium resistance protein CzcD [Janthinobacterium sp. HH01]OEZ53803.1 cobalt-zinc-cadmium resistance protein CzcD [Duganella sp. HH105]OFA00812.1 cobalt-zinc-cadmium resistance protein CzcD [Duganella sp. HH101]